MSRQNNDIDDFFGDILNEGEANKTASVPVSVKHVPPKPVPVKSVFDQVPRNHVAAAPAPVVAPKKVQSQSEQFALKQNKPAVEVVVSKPIQNITQPEAPQSSPFGIPKLQQQRPTISPAAAPVPRPQTIENPFQSNMDRQKQQQQTVPVSKSVSTPSETPKPKELNAFEQQLLRQKQVSVAPSVATPTLGSQQKQHKVENKAIPKVIDDYNDDEFDDDTTPVNTLLPRIHSSIYTSTHPQHREVMRQLLKRDLRLPKLLAEITLVPDQITCFSIAAQGHTAKQKQKLMRGQQQHRNVQTQYGQDTGTQTIPPASLSKSIQVVDGHDDGQDNGQVHMRDQASVDTSRLLVSLQTMGKAMGRELEAEVASWNLEIPLPSPDKTTIPSLGLFCESLLSVVLPNICSDRVIVDVKPIVVESRLFFAVALQKPVVQEESRKSEGLALLSLVVFFSAQNADAFTVFSTHYNLTCIDISMKEDCVCICGGTEDGAVVYWRDDQASECIRGVYVKSSTASIGHTGSVSVVKFVREQIVSMDMYNTCKQWVANPNTGVLQLTSSCTTPISTNKSIQIAQTLFSVAGVKGIAMTDLTIAMHASKNSLLYKNSTEYHQTNSHVTYLANNGEYLYAGSGDGSLTVFQVNKGKLETLITLPSIIEHDIVQILPIPTRPAAFFVYDSAHKLAYFDLCANTEKAIVRIDSRVHPLQLYKKGEAPPMAISVPIAIANNTQLILQQEQGRLQILHLREKFSKTRTSEISLLYKNCNYTPGE